MTKKPAFWVRVFASMKRKRDKGDGEAIWGIKRRIGDHAGRARIITVSGQHLSAKRVMRHEAERAGLALTGRQWRMLRKQMRREEQAAPVQKAA